jgi:hypothetical protein
MLKRIPPENEKNESPVRMRPETGMQTVTDSRDATRILVFKLMS